MRKKLLGLFYIKQIESLQVLNAAMLYWPMQNVLYVEGYALDRFAEGLWALQPVHQNKVLYKNIELLLFIC